MRKVWLTKEQIQYIVENLRGYLPLSGSRNNIFYRGDKLFQEGTPTQLLEGLITTYPIEEVFEHFKKYCHFTDDYSNFCKNMDSYSGFITIVEMDNGVVGFDIFYHNSFDNEKRIDNLLNMAGYYTISETEYDNNIKRKEYVKKFTDSVNDYVYQHDVIYHITLKDRLEKIMRNGLCPRDERKKNSNPERVYFLVKKPTIETFMALLPDMFSKKQINNAILLTISTKDLNVKFEFDPCLEGGIYTSENIPPKNIISVDTIPIMTK